MARPEKGPLKPLDAMEISASASPIAFPAPHAEYTPNCIWVDGAGTVTLTINGRSVPFTPVAGVWHPMPNYTHMTAATATGVKAGVAL